MIHPRTLGLAVGATSALLYLGCIIVMSIVGKDISILFFNSLLHGLDVSTIIRMDIPVYEVFFGIAETFILGWLVGVCIGGIYNFSLRRLARESEAGFNAQNSKHD